MKYKKIYSIKQIYKNQLAQAGGQEQQGAVGTNYVKARPDSESSFSWWGFGLAWCWNN